MLGDPNMELRLYGENYQDTYYEAYHSVYDDVYEDEFIGKWVRDWKAKRMNNPKVIARKEKREKNKAERDARKLLKRPPLKKIHPKEKLPDHVMIMDEPPPREELKKVSEEKLKNLEKVNKAQRDELKSIQELHKTNGIKKKVDQEDVKTEKLIEQKELLKVAKIAAISFGAIAIIGVGVFIVKQMNTNPAKATI